jgi:hypothetical protein
MTDDEKWICECDPATNPYLSGRASSPVHWEVKSMLIVCLQLLNCALWICFTIKKTLDQHYCVIWGKICCETDQKIGIWGMGLCTMTAHAHHALGMNLCLKTKWLPFQPHRTHKI